MRMNEREKAGTYRGNPATWKRKSERWVRKSTTRKKNSGKKLQFGGKNGNVINENLGELDEIYSGKHHQLTQAGSRMNIRNKTHS